VTSNSIGGIRRALDKHDKWYGSSGVTREAPPALAATLLEVRLSPFVLPVPKCIKIDNIFLTNSMGRYRTYDS